MTDVMVCAATAMTHLRRVRVVLEFCKHDKIAAAELKRIDAALEWLRGLHEQARQSAENLAKSQQGNRG